MLFLGLDIGTTRMKCGIYDESGNLLYSDLRDYGELKWEKESYVDIDAIFSAALDILKRAYEKCPFDSLAVSSLGESFVLLDETDNVLFAPMLYTDPRGTEEAEDFEKDAEEIFKISGVYPQGMYSAYKLMWIKKHRPETYARAAKVLLVNEYIAYRLTGNRAIDESQAARTGVFDIRGKKFSSRLLQMFDLKADLFSPVIGSGEAIGRVKREYLSAWNAEKEILVVAGAHDQVSATLGSGCTVGGMCSDGMGTVECLTAVYNTPSSDDDMGKSGYPNVPFLNGQYCTYLLNYSCGSLTRWWLSSCFSEKEICDGSAFEKAERDFTNAPTGILVLPYFAGAATPYRNIDAKGAILRLSLSDSPSKIYQGILEGLCYEMRLNLEEAGRYGIIPEKIIATGGGAASKKWLQMKADIFNLPVYPLRVKEAGVCGAAILAALPLLKEPLEAIAGRFVGLGEPYLPRKGVHEAYMSVYNKYKKLYKTIKEL